jgi:hypothetical protein
MAAIRASPRVADRDQSEALTPLMVVMKMGVVEHVYGSHLVTSTPSWLASYSQDSGYAVLPWVTNL